MRKRRGEGVGGWEREGEGRSKVTKEKREGEMVMERDSGKKRDV